MKPKVYLAELIGTFALTMVGAGAGAQDAGLMAVALAHGLALLTMVYVFGPISGAHVNPAVTLGLAFAKKIEWKDAVFYWIAQVLGAVLAAAFLVLVLGDISSGATTFDGNPLIAVLLEAVLTFFLVNAVFQAAVKGSAGKHAGLVIGLTLTAMILVGGPVTGASLNPARTFGPALFTGTLGQYWVYVVGPAAGSILAALYYKYQD